MRGDHPAKQLDVLIKRIDTCIKNFPNINTDMSVSINVGGPQAEGEIKFKAATCNALVSRLTRKTIKRVENPVHVYHTTSTKVEIQ